MQKIPIYLPMPSRICVTVGARMCDNQTVCSSDRRFTYSHMVQSYVSKDIYIHV